MLDPTLRRALPFALLGIAAVAGLLKAPSAEADPDPSLRHETPVVEAEGSVRLDARLESTHLSAGQPVETYARVLLEGVEPPGTKERLPLALTILIDQSGSMSGDKIVSARESALRVLDQLRTDDRVSVVVFSSGARVLVPSLTIGRAGAAALEDARARIRALPATGGTDMAAGLDLASERAFALYGEERVNRLLLLSDGQPDTEVGLKERVTSLARRGVHTTTLGVGRDYNEDLMASLADAGLGNYWFIESPSQMAHIFTRELETLASVVAKEAVVTLSAKGGVEVLEAIGWPGSPGGGGFTVPVGDVYGGRKAEILLRLRVPAARAGDVRDLLDVGVRYHDALANEARGARRTLAATFSDDAAAVLASRDLGVAKKAEEVRTARALEEASSAYTRGDRAAARRIYTEQKTRVEAFAAVAGEAYAPAAAEMERALDVLDEAAEKNDDVSLVQKRAKATARQMRR